MRRFGVWEAPGDGIASGVAAGLWICGIPFLRMRPPARCQCHPALLIVGPGADTAPAPALHLRWLLLPGGRGLPWATADCAVSYGLSPKDSITLSSLAEDRLLLSLQRELVTVTGAVVERQEICLPRSVRRGTEETLAVCGGLLLLGVPPERLCRCRI